MKDLIHFANNTLDVCSQIIRNEPKPLLALVMASTVPYAMLGVFSAYLQKKYKQD